MPLILFLRQVIQQAGQHKIGQMSAAFAYGAVFSLGPLLLIFISLLGIVYGQAATEGRLYGQLAGTFGSEMALSLQDMVARLSETGNGVIAVVAGTIGVLLGAAGMSSQLQDSFNTIFGAVRDPRGGIKRTVLVKVKNILIILLFGLFIIVSVAVTAFTNAIGSTVQESLGLPTVILEILNTLVSLGILTGLLFGVYRVLPDVLIPRRIALVGSLIVACLFAVGKIILALIIANNATASAYGAAAVLISLLLWTYYLGQILLTGALGMQVYGHNRLLVYKPKKHALQRTTVHVDGSQHRSRIITAWLRGYRRRKNAK